MGERVMPRAMSRSWSWLAMAALGAACDEPIPFAWETRDSPATDAVGATDGIDAGADAFDDVPVVTAPCPIADEVFTPWCVECHDGDRYPDLRAGALGALAGAPARAYAGRTVVVAGDASASLLLDKMHGASGVGPVMPPDGALDGQLVDAVAAWITSGAPACGGVEPIDPVDPGPPVPGDTITFGGPPSGFQSTRPTWADAGTCTAQQWWKYAGDTESASMHPGRACIDCHTREGEGPRFSYAGTVYPSVVDSDDCRGVQGVEVEILDDGDQVLGRTTTNAAGNFAWRKTALAFHAGYRARLTYQGRSREMTLPQATSGDCNTCHGASGTDGAPGRMVAP